MSGRDVEPEVVMGNNVVDDYKAVNVYISR